MHSFKVMLGACCEMRGYVPSCSPKFERLTKALLGALSFLLILGASAAAAQTTQYQPQVGQVGKDVVWVPTPDRVIYRMLQMADTTQEDLVVDLGSGDGRIPIVAAKRFGARSLGIEFDADLVEYSRTAAQREGVGERARFLRQDFFQTDLSAATVITLYVSPTVMMQLRPRLLALRAGTRVVSHQFTFGDWEPDETVRVENVPAHLWVVPARAAGVWQVDMDGHGYTVNLEQEHQMLRGSASLHPAAAKPAGAKPADAKQVVTNGRLRGDEVRFAFADGNGDQRLFSGRIEGGRMHGVARAYGQPDLNWSATRQ